VRQLSGALLARFSAYLFAREHCTGGPDAAGPVRPGYGIFLQALEGKYGLAGKSTGI